MERGQRAPSARERPWADLAVSKRAVCAAREQAERAWAGLRAKFQAARLMEKPFSFSFYTNFA